MNNHECTHLWSRGLAASANEPNGAVKERLRVAHRQFWSNATTLAREIQRDVPNLTLHDEAHFEALWARADQIAGNLELTPLETFVFGGAILLHDTANSVAAFPGRLGEIEATPEWRDAAAAWRDRAGTEPHAALPAEAATIVLFEALRALHAERAQTLAGFAVEVDGRQTHLLQDDQLRTHLGPLIGAIAASHHWDVDTLRKKLPPQQGALTGMPAEWTIRPVLLACLLRCADATQLDQQRAPDFLYGLLQLHGLSELHWRAQNRLAIPHVDPNDTRTLVFTSTMPFAEADADAWWIAYDAIQMANRELQACRSLLGDLRLPALAIHRIAGAESAERLAEHVTVKGWRPVAARVKISEVDRVVDMFAGKELYGPQMAVPLRELIQNSADAIRFRRELEPQGAGYEGAVTVELRLANDGSDDVWLVVEDDGLGMSEAVLTGPLIDFGSSYMSSALVKAERPGLLSKGRQRIGKFGIGFFSAFMLGDEVHVASRPFDKGLDFCRTLCLNKRALARPLLLDQRPDDFSATTSTRVAIRVKSEEHAAFLTLNAGGQVSHKITIGQLVGTLCPMLDVDVFVVEGGAKTRIHTRRWMDEDRLTWLRRILLPDVRGREKFDPDLERAAARLSFLDPEDPSAGLACVSCTSGSGVTTVGTLKATTTFNPFKDEFVGAIDYAPGGPRRDTGCIRAQAKLAEWATGQALKAKHANLPLPQRQYVARRVALFGGDATPIASIQLKGEWRSLEEIFELLAGGEALWAPLKVDEPFHPDRLLITKVRERHSGWVDSYRPGELEYLLPTLEGSDHGDGNDAYYAVEHDNVPAPVSFTTLLRRYANAHGYALDLAIENDVSFAKYVGASSERDRLIPGKVIVGSALKLSVRKD
jgi:hypothetical protein